MPAIFVSHGAPTLVLTSAEPAHLFLKDLSAALPAVPRAIVVVSAHWEDDAFAVTSAARHSTMHDFTGFPAELYDLRYDAPGDPALAARVAALIADADLPSRLDDTRGLDHGAWVPLLLAWPNAEIPVVQISLRRGLEAAAHLALGRALAPLRDEGVLILGSGGAVHNLRALDWGSMDAPARQSASEPWAADFEGWLRETVGLPGDRRAARFSEWLSAPSAPMAHPRAEHLMPLLATAGAAGNDPATLLHESWQMGTLSLSAWHFGP